MKKFLALSAAMLTICAVFTGCGGSDKKESSAGDNTTVTDNTTEYRENDNNNNMTDTGSDNAAGDYVSDVIDGVESAGEDIVDGVGDAAGDIADGITGREEHTSETTDNR